MSKYLEYFSLVPHVYSIPIRAENENADGNKPIVDRLQIAPGKNQIPAEKWEQIDREDPRIQSRLDRGHLMDSEPNDMVKEATLEGRPPPKLVSQLSAKSEEIAGFDKSNPQSEDHKVFE